MAKFPWGSQPFTMSSLFVSQIIGACVIGGALVYHGPDGGVTGLPEQKDLYGVALVTMGWVTMWYVFLGHQIQFKFANIDEEQKKVAAFIADRGVVNTMEQCLPFFLLMWLHAIFVNPQTSAIVGWIYVAFRFLYPFAYGFYGQFTNLVEVPAQVDYGCITWFFGAITYKLMKDSDLHSDLPPFCVPLIVFLFSWYISILFLVASMPGAAVITKGVAWEAAYKPPLASQ